MRKLGKLGKGLPALLVICVIATTAQGVGGYFVDKNGDLYGNLKQYDVSTDWGAVACAPTAAINSFVYLENKYGYVYDDLLVPGDDYQAMVDAAFDLGQNYMNTPPGGTSYEDFIGGKYKWIEQRKPDWTRYEAQMSSTWNESNFWNWQKPDWVEDNTDPTWEFIYQELSDCEDVELGLTYDAGGGHCVTPYVFSFTDADQDGVLDQTEAFIVFVDPLTGGEVMANIWQSGPGTVIETSYGGGATITMAVSESPLPEPVTMLGVFAGVAGIGGYLRRRRREA